jgi:hypothetical protein
MEKILVSTVLAATFLLSGCGAEILNQQAAQELAKSSKPPGSLYLGWRIFQDKCSACHGPSATGTSSGPDLLPRVREMGSREFVSLVLKRYKWDLPVYPASQPALVDDILQRKPFMVTMPAWDGEPVVTAHIMDLQAYVSARAQGTVGAGRPTP